MSEFAPWITYYHRFVCQCKDPPLTRRVQNSLVLHGIPLMRRARNSPLGISFPFSGLQRCALVAHCLMPHVQRIGAAGDCGEGWKNKQPPLIWSQFKQVSFSQAICVRRKFHACRKFHRRFRAQNNHPRRDLLCIFFFWVDPSAFVFAPVIANERRRTLRKRERNGRKSRFPLLCVLQLFFLPSAQSHMALNYEAHWAYTMAHSRLRWKRKKIL